MVNLPKKKKGNIFRPYISKICFFLLTMDNIFNGNLLPKKFLKITFYFKNFYELLTYHGRVN